MCFKTVFYIYWIVGLATTGLVFELMAAKAKSRYPGATEWRQRTLAEFPAMIVAAAIGMLLWAFGADAVAASICG